MRLPHLRTLSLAAAVALGGATLVACTTTQHDPAASRADRQAIDANTNATLAKLYDNVSDSRELVANAKGVLVFPSVVGGSLIVGAEHGKGALRVGNQTVDYYSTTGGSIGFQAGAQSRAIIYVFNTTEALEKFRASSGWVAGVDATVALANVGANGRLDTKSAQAPIVGFVFNNVGLEAGVSLQGSKISRIAP